MVESRDIPFWEDGLPLPTFRELANAQADDADEPIIRALDNPHDQFVPPAVPQAPAQAPPPIPVPTTTPFLCRRRRRPLTQFLREDIHS